MTTKGPVDVFVSDKPPERRVPQQAGKRAPAGIGTVGARLEELECAITGRCPRTGSMWQIDLERLRG